MGGSEDWRSPEKIEEKSFAAIGEELMRRGIFPDAEEAPVIMRVIHATADFDFAETLTCTNGAPSRIKEALLAGADIVTDTEMARAGINKKVLARLGGSVRCYMSDSDVAAEARRRGVTRAIVSMEKAAAARGKCIFAIGNAPTALLRLHELMAEGKLVPAGIIAVPVGFVNVVEAKELILGDSVPVIAARGRKGGSSIAAAVCNALLYETAGR